MKPKLKYIRVEDNNFQHLQVLKENRTKRHRFKEFCVEGVRSINSLLAHNWEISAFYYPANRKLSEWARQILGQSKAPYHYEVNPLLMEKLSEKEETSELLVAAKMPSFDLARIKIHPNLLVVILDRPNSPGNLGTSIRSCDVFGVDGVIVTGHGADVFHPQAIRGSMGSLFAQTVLQVAAQVELLKWLEMVRTTMGSLQIIGSSAKAEMPLSEVKISGPTILIAGNETFGMNANYQELCDTTVSIPQFGWASSLNVSCALSILLYEISKQR